ncbi:hypothetical protein KYJ26_11730 [Bacillus sp. MCCB 382]|uniref:hypothetical protein n=1 Tax=Bacillus sp. MCCB 382 TaxID=2860197 RepID=UPI001C576675|nr:hypothetical protein [Bacillus sp. MCCB 382]
MIKEIISNYHHETTQDPHHRFKSWEHCYRFFSKHHQHLEDEDISDQACLQLAFYLASWGMLRGSSFLLFKDYKVHQYFIREVVRNPVYKDPFQMNEGEFLDVGTFKDMDKLIGNIRNVYLDNITVLQGKEVEINVSDTLVTKIMLGVFGNVPTYDRYFKMGIALFGFNQQLNARSLGELANFYNEHVGEFRACRRLLDSGDIHYTPMKLVDMYFWQIGYMLESSDQFEEEIRQVVQFATDYKLKKRNAPMARIQSSTKSVAEGSGLTDSIRKHIMTILNEEANRGSFYIDIRSGDIHKEMGLRNRIVPVCNAMLSLGAYRYQVLHRTASGFSTTNVVRYFLKEEVK